MAAEVSGVVAGAQSELPVAAVGGVDLAGQVQVQEWVAIIADGEEVGGIERDYHRLGHGAESDRRLGDNSIVPTHTDERSDR